MLQLWNILLPSPCTQLSENCAHDSWERPQWWKEAQLSKISLCACLSARPPIRRLTMKLILKKPIVQGRRRRGTIMKCDYHNIYQVQRLHGRVTALGQNHRRLVLSVVTLYTFPEKGIVCFDICFLKYEHKNVSSLLIKEK